MSNSKFIFYFIEAQIHKDIFSLFYILWSNKQSKLYEIISYILNNMNGKSRTWCKYFSNICQQYGIENPSELIKQDPPSKSSFKKNIETRILSFHENEQRKRASNIKRMKYFNISLFGLNSKCHPAILNIISVHDMKKNHYHMKMLLGDLYTYEIKSRQSGGDPFCVLCMKISNGSTSEI